MIFIRCANFRTTATPIACISNTYAVVPLVNQLLQLKAAYEALAAIRNQINPKAPKILVSMHEQHAADGCVQKYNFLHSLLKQHT